MQVHDDRRAVLFEAIYAFTEDCCRITYRRGNEPFVSWSSLGAVDIEKAGEFIRWLDAVTYIADQLRQNDVKFIDNGDLDPDMESQDEYDAAQYNILSLLEQGDYDAILDWILDGELV